MRDERKLVAGDQVDVVLLRAVSMRLEAAVCASQEGRTNGPATP